MQRQDVGLVVAAEVVVGAVLTVAIWTSGAMTDSSKWLTQALVLVFLFAAIGIAMYAGRQ